MSDEVIGAACRWCGMVHGPLCPYVKALEFGDFGTTVSRVEFFSPVELVVQQPRALEPEAEPEYPKLGPAA